MVCVVRGVCLCVMRLSVLRVVYYVVMYGLFLLFLFVWVLCEYVCVMCLLFNVCFRMDRVGVAVYLCVRG